VQEVEGRCSEDEGGEAHPRRNDLFFANGRNDLVVDVSYAARQAHRIVNVALHREYSLGIVFIFSQGRKNLYHV
jgi:hypothetical protein